MDQLAPWWSEGHNKIAIRSAGLKLLKSFSRPAVKRPSPPVRSPATLPEKGNPYFDPRAAAMGGYVAPVSMVTGKHPVSRRVALATGAGIAGRALPAVKAATPAINAAVSPIKGAAKVAVPGGTSPLTNPFLLGAGAYRVKPFRKYLPHIVGFGAMSGQAAALSHFLSRQKNSH